MEIARSRPHAKIHGIDFSEANIESARAKADGLDNVSFEVCDLRTYMPRQSYDIILCLYDVIGSLPEDADNRRILDNLAASCKTGGLLVLSVMNMELTEALAKPSNIGDIHANPRILFDLPPSDVMHKSGDIFDPDYFAIDSATGLVYRKEQFNDDSALPAEYVIRDKRYRAGEISDLVSGSGFDVIDTRYVRAGRWDEPLGATDLKAKEILVVARMKRLRTGGPNVYIEAGSQDVMAISVMPYSDTRVALIDHYPRLQGKIDVQGHSSGLYEVVSWEQSTSGISKDSEE